MARDYFGIIQRKIREQTNPLFVKSRRQRLNRCDFSIISNNCWGGSVYRYFGLPYQSPTAGLFFSLPITLGSPRTSDTTLLHPSSLSMLMNHCIGTF